MTKDSHTKKVATEAYKVIQLVNHVKDLGINCPSVQQQPDHILIKAAIRLFREESETALLNYAAKNIRENKGEDQYWGFIAFSIHHMPLKFQASKQKLRNRKKGIFADNIPSKWQAWAREHPQHIQSLRKKVARKKRKRNAAKSKQIFNKTSTTIAKQCDDCGRFFEGTSASNSIQNHVCSPKSSSIRTVSGGGGPGTGQRR